MPDSSTMALTGGLASLLALGVAARLVVAWTQRVEATTPRSLVAPVLAVDALVPRLRALYTRTRILDRDGCDDEGAGERSSAAGRELRRLLLTGQAAWIARRLDLDQVSAPIEALLEAAEDAAARGYAADKGGVAQRSRELRATWEELLDSYQMEPIGSEEAAAPEAAEPE